VRIATCARGRPEPERAKTTSITLRVKWPFTPATDTHEAAPEEEERGGFWHGVRGDGNVEVRWAVAVPEDYTLRKTALDEIHEVDARPAEEWREGWSALDIGDEGQDVFHGGGSQLGSHEGRGITQLTADAIFSEVGVDDVVALA